MRLRKLKLLSGAALAVSALCIAQSASAFSFNGYFRAGAGVNSEGGRLVCYRLPGSQADFRLGNECETVYAEIVLSDVVYDEGGTTAGFHTRVAYIDYTAAQDVTGQEDFNALEFWSYIKNPLGGGAKWWAGKRFYRYGVHINDFFYWNQSGTGGGVSGVDLGFGQFSYAVIFNAATAFDNSLSNNHIDDDSSAIKNIFQLKGIQLNPGGKLQFAFIYTYGQSGGGPNFSGDPVDGSNDGWSLLVQHTQTGFLMDGSKNRLVFQYGSGASAELDIAANPVYDSDINTFRVLDALVANFIPDFSMSVVGLYQHTNNADEAATLPKNWYQIGTRLVYYVNDNFRLNLALNSSWVENPDVVSGDSVTTMDDTARLTKITFAPSFVVGRGFFARPELRLFATYADWNGAADGYVMQAGTDPFSSTSGWTFGVQTEVWW